MNKRTPWTQSSILSDRIKPQNTPSSTPKNRGKAREGAAQQPPKSVAVRSIETTIKKLQIEPGDQKDPKGGCFCLAQTHEPSPYHPICSSCGLILCLLNKPYYACPHCSAVLLSPTTKEILLSRLQVELSDTIAKEEEEAERARDDARQAAGAFPSLSGGDASSQAQQNRAAQSHKVLSLNSKTKRVTVASYGSSPTLVSNSNSNRLETRKEESPERVPPPSVDIAVARGRSDVGRPWMDTRGDGFVRTLTYVRDPRIDREQLKEDRKARKLKKKRDAINSAEDDNGETAGDGGIAGS
ncbi:uncharacterized protein FOMMEDRAFT_113707 [Fomitiporia mediterranea MF3/22]|uniref:uncharacterized protein n=1 Tax=Fomitiporia mediterranea (strain MF3/22) TaxID=694068 RepID=UPI0004409921|nr:uncharacterized protein FOMMEDRAFT_113707 [Fomitiporia mediterranea MF3/22]EJC98565.1 hypothetical protein FOMMEDRAFT_113707 [Fomitiporia mediterranea MF3/22]